MTDFPVHTPETAPEGSKAMLEGMKQTMGMVPNIMAILSESPTALKGYHALAGVVAEGSLTPTERLLVMLVASDRNGCRYCTAAHSAQAKQAKVEDAVIEALRTRQPLESPRLEALRQLTIALVDRRGWLEDEDIQPFLDAGWEKGQVFEVITIVALKTITNYLNHVAETPVDAPFQKFMWEAVSV